MSFIQKMIDRKNIEFHYDLPAYFFECFLGKTMNYTSAIYPTEKSTLDEAQLFKMDTICKKLMLQKNDSLVDVGCGFGGLIIHAAKNYKVKATGITLSRTQFEYVQKWIKQEKLQSRCNVLFLNYRDLPQNTFNKAVSVEMSNHVGLRHIRNYFDTVYRTLVPGGLFLYHEIATKDGMKYDTKNTFMNKYVFPGAEILKPHEQIEVAARSGFELLSSENLREHYVKTLCAWVKNMEEKEKEICSVVSPEIYRAYKIFWAGCALAYKRQVIMVYQHLFQKTKLDL
jgi:cyclopropane-fatty-acyl-phospholipid synthase